MKVLQMWFTRQVPSNSLILPILKIVTVMKGFYPALSIFFIKFWLIFCTTLSLTMLSTPKSSANMPLQSINTLHYCISDLLNFIISGKHSITILH